MDVFNTVFTNLADWLLILEESWEKIYKVITVSQDTR